MFQVRVLFLSPMGPEMRAAVQRRQGVTPRTLEEPLRVLSILARRLPHALVVVASSWSPEALLGKPTLASRKAKKVKRWYQAETKLVTSYHTPYPFCKRDIGPAAWK